MLFNQIFDLATVESNESRIELSELIGTMLTVKGFDNMCPTNKVIDYLVRLYQREIVVELSKDFVLVSEDLVKCYAQMMYRKIKELFKTNDEIHKKICVMYDKTPTLAKFASLILYYISRPG